MLASSSDAVPNAEAAGASQHHLVDQLDLTDAQKQEIAQVRQTVADHKARHQAILKILTPEQRTRLKELRASSTSSPTLTSTPASETKP